MRIFADQDPTTNPFNEFLKNYGIWIAIAVASLVFITVLVLFFISLYKKKTGTYDASTVKSVDANEFLSCLGGKENVKRFDVKGSRLTLELNDDNLLQESKLSDIGVSSVIKMSSKIILVIQENMDSYVKALS